MADELGLSTAQFALFVLPPVIVASLILLGTLAFRVATDNCQKAGGVFTKPIGTVYFHCDMGNG